MLGSMSEAFDRTVRYLKQREQFGVPIGSFQALKHRAANLFVEIELCRSVVMAAARALDEGDAEASRLVSLAKARCSDAFVLVTNEAVQMHGGVGMTDEFDIGFYMKRARVAEVTFGDGAWHRDSPVGARQHQHRQHEHGSERCGPQQVTQRGRRPGPHCSGGHPGRQQEEW